MKPAQKLRIGELLVKEGLITEEELMQALTAQKSQSAWKPIGEVLVQLRLVSRVDLKQILKKHQKNLNLGDILINLGLINREQLLELVKHQKEHGGKVEEILVQKGFVTESELIDTLSIQMGVPKIIPDFNLIDTSLLKGVNVAYLAKHRVLPAFKNEDVLTVIMADPLAQATIDDLEKFFACKIEPAIAPSKDIQNTLDSIGKYRGRVEFDKDGDATTGLKSLIIEDANLSEKSGDEIIGIVNYIITNAFLKDATDIHIEPRQSTLSVSNRIDGILHHETDLPLAIAPKIVSCVKAVCKLDITEKNKHQDNRVKARIMDREVDLSVSIYPSFHGENLVIKILSHDTLFMELDSLGFSEANLGKYTKVLDSSSGIILATGPPGSGKSSTLYASINHLNDAQKTIITAEDPIKCVIDGAVQGQVEDKPGFTYMDFIKSMARQDPDVIMIGEFRDRETVEASIQAALNGNKVLSKLHTGDTAGSFLRLMDMGIEPFLISSSMVAVIGQRLVRLLCKHCKVPHQPEGEIFHSLNISSIETDKYEFFRPRGCQRCNNTGFRGRTAIHELLVINDSMREAIRERKPPGEIRALAREETDMIFMHEDGFFKATQGITSLEEILRVIFLHESDKESPRSAEEIVAACEGKRDAALA
jgi:type IV pilus assembly protein PilB